MVQQLLYSAVVRLMVQALFVYKIASQHMKKSLTQLVEQLYRDLRGPSLTAGASLLI